MSGEVGRDGVPPPSANVNATAGGGTPALPIRKRLDHRGPLSVEVKGAWYFITVCANDHGPWAGECGSHDRDFDSIAKEMLSAARWYHEHGKWRLALFLVMPDHVHFIVHVPTAGGGTPALPHVIRHWKHYVAEHCGLSFQRDFWDTRLRDDAHYAEVFRYVCNNPVRKGLCELAVDWPYVIAFDRVTGEERKHRGRDGVPSPSANVNATAGDGTPALPAAGTGRDGVPSPSANVNATAGGGTPALPRKMMCGLLWLCAFCSSFLFFAFSAFADSQFVIARGKTANVAICVPKGAGAPTRHAAEALAKYLGEMSGAK